MSGIEYNNNMHQFICIEKRELTYKKNGKNSRKLIYEQNCHHIRWSLHCKNETAAAAATEKARKQSHMNKICLCKISEIIENMDAVWVDIDDSVWV